MLAAYLSCIADASGPLASGAVAVAATYFSLFENASMLGAVFFMLLHKPVMVML